MKDRIKRVLLFVFEYMILFLGTGNWVGVIPVIVLVVVNNLIQNIKEMKELLICTMSPVIGFLIGYYILGPLF